MAFLINVPLVVVALWAAIRHVEEIARPATPRATSTGSARSSGRSRSAGWRSARSAARSRSGPTTAPGSRSGVGAVQPRPLPDPDGRPAAPARPAVAVPQSRVRDDQPGDVPDLRRPVRRRSPTPRCSTRGRSATARPGRRSSACRRASCSPTLSARVGGLTARFGARIFLVAGPLIVAAGPALAGPDPGDLGAVAGRARPSPATLVPPIDALIDVLPSVVAFGLGMAMVVAPLTSTLMGSIPARNSGLGSAINNALSRVGQPLLGAVIFVAITASFYTALAATVPGLDPADPAVRSGDRAAQPAEGGHARRPGRGRAKAASVDAFHLAALVSAGLMIAGSATSAVGLRGRRPAAGGAGEARSIAGAPTGRGRPGSRPDRGAVRIGRRVDRGRTSPDAPSSCAERRTGRWARPVSQFAAPRPSGAAAPRRCCRPESARPAAPRRGGRASTARPAAQRRVGRRPEVRHRRLHDLVLLPGAPDHQRRRRRRRAGAPGSAVAPKKLRTPSDAQEVQQHEQRRRSPLIPSTISGDRRGPGHVHGSART